MSTPQSNITVSNQASREQLERIFDILGNVFSVGRAFFQERLDNEPTYDPANTWFATVDGVIASTVQIFPMPLRAGQAVLKVGGMGSVGTDENYQGKGLASRILSAQTAWMEQQGYHLSMLLASRHSFYSRSGWQLLPETMLVLNNSAYQASNGTASTQASAGTDSEKLKPVQTQAPLQADAVEGFSITPFSLEHIEEMSRLYDRFNANRTGTYVRNNTYWNSLVKWPTWKEAECLLLWQQNKLIAYGIIAHTSNEQAILREFIYDPQHEADVMPLFAALCELRNDTKQILAKLPGDHMLHQHFKVQGSGSIELNIAMWKIIDGAGLFDAMHEELQKRLQSNQALSGQGFELRLQTKKLSIYFSYAGKQLQISVSSFEPQAGMKPNSNSDIDASLNGIAVDTTEITLIKWLLYGYQAEDEKAVAVSGKPDSETESVLQEKAGAILQALFPEQTYAFYITDYY